MDILIYTNIIIFGRTYIDRINLLEVVSYPGGGNMDYTTTTNFKFNKMVTLEKIMEATCYFYDTTPAELFAQNREDETIKRRFMFMYLARYLTDHSQKDVGKFPSYYGGKVYAHCTVRSAVIRQRGIIDVYPNVKSEAEQITKLCGLGDYKHITTLKKAIKEIVNEVKSTTSLVELKEILDSNSKELEPYCNG